jgi:hypothetical protein
MPDINPVAKLATQSGLDIYPAPPGQRIRVGRRFARESEMEDFLATQVRATTAIADAARKGDVACSQALPKDLGEWRSTVEFFLGPFGCGKDLSEVSALDFARSSERDVDAFCRQGFGTLLTKLATGLPMQLNNPVTAIEWGRRTASKWRRRAALAASPRSAATSNRPQDQVRSQAAQAAVRPLEQVTLGWLWRDAGAAWQSAGSRWRLIWETSGPRTASICQCVGRRCAWSTLGTWPRSPQGRKRDGESVRADWLTNCLVPI